MRRNLNSENKNKLIIIGIFCLLLTYCMGTFSLATDKVLVGQAKVVQEGNYTRILIPVSDSVKYKAKNWKILFVWL